MAAKRSIEERIAQLEAQKKALQARLSRQDRARDTRRKVLLGALLLHHIESDSAQGDQLYAWVTRELPGFLTRENDLALFEDFLVPETEPANHSPA